MDTETKIIGYIASQAQPKRDDLLTLHRMILKASPNCRLWFVDGLGADGRIVSNPSVGYGVHAKRYARGEARTFYKLGLSANTTGISLYVMGLDDKTRLSQAYGQSLGKARITGYCVKFRRLEDVNLEVIEQMVRDHLGMEATPQP